MTDTGRIDSEPTDRERSAALSLARLAFEPNHMTSVLLAFSCRRLDAHHCATSETQPDTRLCISGTPSSV